MMTLDEKVGYWIDSSTYDMESACVMQNTGRYVYTVFMCQQAIEKCMKAVHMKIKKIEAPKSHNLIYLSDIVNLKTTDEDKKLLAELSSFYISGRYPDYKVKISASIKKEKAANYLKKTEGFLKWINNYLTK